MAMVVGLESNKEKEETKEWKVEGHGGADAPETNDSIILYGSVTVAADMNRFKSAASRDCWRLIDVGGDDRSCLDLGTTGQIVKVK